MRNKAHLLLETRHRLAATQDEKVGLEQSRDHAEQISCGSSRGGTKAFMD